MVFHRSLSDNKSPQVSRTLLSILADLNNTVVWIVSDRPLIPKSPSLPCCIVFPFSSKVLVFIPLFVFLQFYPVFIRNSKVYFSAGSLFCWLSFGPVIWPWLGNSFISQDSKEFCGSHFLGHVIIIFSSLFFPPPSPFVLLLFLLLLLLFFFFFFFFFLLLLLLSLLLLIIIMILCCIVHCVLINDEEHVSI